MAGNSVVRAGQDIKAACVATGGCNISELFRIVTEFVAACVGEGCVGNCRAVVAAPQIVGAGEVIESPVAVVISQIEECQCAVSVIVGWVECQGAAQTMNCVFRPTGAGERDRAVVCCRDVAGCSDKGAVEQCDGAMLVPLGGAYGGQILQDGGVVRRCGQGGTVGRFGILMAAGGMVRLRCTG